MKKLFLLSISAMLFAVVAQAQAPIIKFEKSAYDFGTINEENGIVTASFEFTNDGDAPLIVNKVSASCGCTVAEWTHEPVSAKGKGFIKVSYNPKNRPGQFVKSVTVRSNASEQPVTLQIKGEVILERK